MTTPTPNVDTRFSDPSAGPTAWADAERVLVDAELYWLTTVRADGRPHVTPLIGVFHDGALHFCTGRREQKHRNLDANPRVALTTGANAWAAGTDVVVEGTAVPVTAHDELHALADAYVAKYGEVWRFEVGDGAFGSGEDAATVFRVEADKVLAFAKDPHAQTTFRFGGH
jgi:nitroimidazol reductase NimA-like FMN-containing flavoprotein (pyridoxamine 5'-phosphate oxidase superfamily)